MIPLVIISIIIVAVAIYLIYTSSKKAEERRLKSVEEVELLLPSIRELLKQFNSLTDYENGYFNNFKLQSWKEAALPVKTELEKIPFSNLKLEQSKLTVLNLFVQQFNNAENNRKYHNQSFVEHELKTFTKLFDNVEGHKLDEQQRRAIVIDEDNNIVVAGAGSGKTTTIAGKVSYLLTKFDLDPSEILLIAFTTKARDEMRERIKKKLKIDIDVMTFHKLGKEIIAEATGKQPSVFDPPKLSDVINGFLTELMQNQTYLSKVTKFFTEFLKPYKEEDEFESHGEYIQFIKDNNIKCLKQKEVTINGHRTLLREQCKSIEEVIIANFLFLNNITYEYERTYVEDVADRNYAQYKPDFYLPQHDIWIEHFGISRNGDVPRWFSGDEHRSAKEKYQDGMRWKRETHRRNQSTLIETYSWEKREGVLLENLQRKLEEKGVILIPKTPEEVWEILKEIAEDEVTNFTQLITTFLNLLKSNNLSVEAVSQKNVNLYSGQEKNRNAAFIELFMPILTKYKNHLAGIAEIDFSDMINHAADYALQGQAEVKYRYILIDEFQDISIGRYKLIKAILDKNLGCKLFCVGDDWQSIYRFTGSDISIFTEFEKYFGATERSFIETTYRFNSRLINISSGFILKNPKQIKKKLKSYNNEDFVPYQILFTESIYNNDTTPVISALNSINEEIEKENGSIKILALGRYSHDLDFIKKDSTNFSVAWDQATKSSRVTLNQLPDLQIEFLTVHKAKGLEADYILLLNCSSGKYGFPSEQADDPILNLLLTQADQFPNGEERRLFYVAMTRCRRKVFMISKSKYKSKFIVELETENNLLTERKCPKCKSGTLKESFGTSQRGTDWHKLSCSNWSWGCDYVEWL